MTDTVAVSPGVVTGTEDADDLGLLRQYEPILRFTHGELFFPMPAERYLESAALLAGSDGAGAAGRHPGGRAERGTPGRRR